MVRSYSLSSKCSKFTGRDLLQSIEITRKEDKLRNSSVVIYDAKAVHVGDHNWLAYILKNVIVQNEFMTTCIDFQRPFIKNEKYDMVGKYLRNSRIQEQCPENCLQKTLIVVDTADFWNWWWVLVVLSAHYTILLSILPDLNTDDVEILHLAEDGRERERVQMPLRNIYYSLFSTKGNKRLDKRTKFVSVCYSNVVLLPTRENPSILKNIRHLHAKCVSPIMISLNLFLRKQFVLEGRKANQICWMYRKHKIAITSWQKIRHIHQQDDMISEIGMKKLDFGKHTFLKDQIEAVNECKLLIGAHGAGLNLAVVMKKPVLLELTPGKISNRNAQNLMWALNGCVNVVPIVFSQINAGLIRYHIEKTKEKCIANV